MSRATQSGSLHPLTVFIKNIYFISVVLNVTPAVYLKIRFHLRAARACNNIYGDGDISSEIYPSRTSVFSKLIKLRFVIHPLGGGGGDLWFRPTATGHYDVVRTAAPGGGVVVNRPAVAVFCTHVRRRFRTRPGPAAGNVCAARTTGK